MDSLADAAGVVRFATSRVRLLPRDGGLGTCRQQVERGAAPGAECVFFSVFSYAPGRKRVKRLCLDSVFFQIVTSSSIVCWRMHQVA